MRRPVDQPAPRSAEQARGRGPRRTLLRHRQDRWPAVGGARAALETLRTPAPRDRRDRDTPRTADGDFDGDGTQLQLGSEGFPPRSRGGGQRSEAYHRFWGPPRLGRILTIGPAGAVFWLQPGALPDVMLARRPPSGRMDAGRIAVGVGGRRDTADEPGRPVQTVKPAARTKPHLLAEIVDGQRLTIDFVVRSGTAKSSRLNFLIPGSVVRVHPGVLGAWRRPRPTGRNDAICNTGVAKCSTASPGRAAKYPHQSSVFPCVAEFVWPGTPLALSQPMPRKRAPAGSR